MFSDGWRRRAAERGREAWLEISAELVSRLSTALDCQLVVDRAVGDVGDGFCVDFRSVSRDRTPYRLGIRGIVGAQDVGEDVSVSAAVFLYSGNERLGLIDRQQEYIEWVFDTGTGEWLSIGWDHGEPDEYRDFVTFDQEPG